MTYLLLEGEFAENTKIQGLSDKAFRLHITALTHCARNLTDGAISEIDLRKLAAISQIGRPNAIVTQLNTAGLWVRNGHGWTIHDYLVHNPSRAEILKKRAVARTRKRNWRNGSRPAGQNAGQAAGVTLPKPPAGRRTSKEGTPPAGPKVCEGCGEPAGFGCLDDCPVMAAAIVRASQTPLAIHTDPSRVVPPPTLAAAAPQLVPAEQADQPDYGERDDSDHDDKSPTDKRDHAALPIGGHDAYEED